MVCPVWDMEPKSQRFTKENHQFTKETHPFTKENHQFKQENHPFTKENHQFTQENHLPNLHILCSMLLFQWCYMFGWQWPVGQESQQAESKKAHFVGSYDAEAPKNGLSFKSVF